MSQIGVVLALLAAASADAEVFDENAERHENVLTCGGGDSLDYVGTVYLDRDTFVREVEIGEVVDVLLRMDLEGRRLVLERIYPTDLSPAEGEEYELRVREYLEGASPALMAKCVVDNFRPDDQLYEFSNEPILPSVQTGYVLVRDGRIVLRVFTRAVYV